MVRGGTHNPWAPPYEFIRDSFLPAIGLMGYEAKVSLVKHGFYPAGGGELRATIVPMNRNNAKPLDMAKRGDVVHTGAKVILSNLPLHIGERERDMLSRELSIKWNDIEIEMVRDPAGPGNAVVVTAECGGHKSVFTGFGQRGKRAEDVAREVCGEYRTWLSSGAAACRHLADQLLIYMALGRGGSFTTSDVTRHFQTNVEIIKRFIEVDVAVERKGELYGVVVGV
jgi:RNA 3'-terminal phosphate cyclase (ATP)